MRGLGFCFPLIYIDSAPPIYRFLFAHFVLACDTACVGVGGRGNVSPATVFLFFSEIFWKWVESRFFAE